MKIYLLLLINYSLAITSWPENPIKLENNTISLNKDKVSCQKLGYWLAQTTKRNSIITQNNNIISVSWHHISLKKAWQQYNDLCQIKQNTIHAIQLKWLILDDFANESLGLDRDRWQISRSNMRASSKLWHTIQQLNDFSRIFDFILNDLKSSQHITAIAEPYLVTTANKKSFLKTQIVMPYIVKTSRTTYNTMQSIPIDLSVEYTKLSNKTYNLQLDSHMQQPWENYQSIWPLAVTEIATNVNLELNKYKVIAQQNLAYDARISKQYKLLPTLRNNTKNTKHKLNLVIIARIISI